MSFTMQSFPAPPAARIPTLLRHRGACRGPRTVPCSPAPPAALAPERRDDAGASGLLPCYTEQARRPCYSRRCGRRGIPEGRWNCAVILYRARESLRDSLAATTKISQSAGTSGGQQLQGVWEGRGARERGGRQVQPRRACRAAARARRSHRAARSSAALRRALAAVACSSASLAPQGGF
jgi:hypothetical protein